MPPEPINCRTSYPPPITPPAGPPATGGGPASAVSSLTRPAMRPPPPTALRDAASRPEARIEPVSTSVPRDGRGTPRQDQGLGGRLTVSRGRPPRARGWSVG